MILVNLLAESEINQVDILSILVSAKQYVGRLNIVVNEAILM